MKKLYKILDKLEDFIINLCVFFLIIIVAVIIYQVVVRKLNISTSGTEEIARYCYVLFVFLLWPIAARHREDLRITVAFDILSKKVRTYAMAIFQIFMAGYSSVCIYSLILNFQNAAKNGLVLPSNTWVHMTWIYVILAAAMVLTALANLLRAAELFAGRATVKTQRELNEEEMAAESLKVTKQLTEGEGGERK